jgi:hypothetical protein
VHFFFQFVLADAFELPLIPLHLNDKTRIITCKVAINLVTQYFLVDKQSNAKLRQKEIDEALTLNIKNPFITRYGE